MTALFLTHDLYKILSKLCLREERQDAYQNVLASSKYSCVLNMLCNGLILRKLPLLWSKDHTQLFLSRYYGLNCVPQSLYFGVMTPAVIHLLGDRTVREEIKIEWSHSTGVLRREAKSSFLHCAYKQRHCLRMGNLQTRQPSPEAESSDSLVVKF